MLRRRLDLTLLLGPGTRLVTRFGTVGLLGLVVDIGVFNLLRQLTETGPLMSKTISVVLATSVAFAGNRTWTFSHRQTQRRLATAYSLFFVVNAFALLISLACLGIGYYVLGLTTPLAENIASNVIGLGLGTLFRFWAYARWVFPREPSAPTHRASHAPAHSPAR